jgi:hypothetical protein
MKKQAVVVIHGMGEQVPMETLGSFVDAVWTTDPSLVDPTKFDPKSGNKFWIKPDGRTRSFELRRITTEENVSGKRTDFFEYYWAHQMTDTTWQQLRAWFFMLMLRNPFRDVPVRVLGAWILMWLVALIAAGIAVYSLLNPPKGAQIWFLTLLAAAATAAVGIVLRFAVAYFGDVARYVRAKPANVGIRQEIRENGVHLLETLMGRKDDGSWGKSDYDRIVVAAHSLGSVIAYDILSHTFSRLNKEGLRDRSAPQPARIELETMIDRAAEGESKLNIKRFQEAQSLAREELNALGNPWIVSDFVTMGCPLVHADFLIAHNKKALGDAKRQRMLPTCPPTLEQDAAEQDSASGKWSFTYQPTPDSARVPHHAALFAYTRWSNLHSPSRFLVQGDIVSGPLGEAMGLEKDGARGAVSGIYDVQVMPALDPDGRPLPDETRPLLAHTKYWTMRRGAPTEQTKRLRALLGLSQQQ